MTGPYIKVYSKFTLIGTLNQPPLFVTYIATITLTLYAEMTMSQRTCMSHLLRTSKGHSVKVGPSYLHGTLPKSLLRSEGQASLPDQLYLPDVPRSKRRLHPLMRICDCHIHLPQRSVLHLLVVLRFKSLTMLILFPSRNHLRQLQGLQRRLHQWVNWHMGRTFLSCYCQRTKRIFSYMTSITVARRIKLYCMLLTFWEDTVVVQAFSEWEVKDDSV